MKWTWTHSLWAFLLYSCINALFILKYGLRIASLSTTIVACGLYVATIAGVLWSINEYMKRPRKSIFYPLIGIAIAGLVMLQLHFDPYELKVDRWSAIHNFLQNLLNGEYPYAAKTHLGGYGSPFPIWQIIHLPFYLLGNVGLSFVFFLLLFTDAIRRIASLREATVAFLLLILSPAFLYEVSVRSDLISNFLLCATILMYLHHYKMTLEKNWVLIAVISGLMMSTRLSIAIPFIVYYFYEYLRCHQTRIQIIFPCLAILIFALTFLPFILWNGKMLFFFEYNPFVLQTRQGLWIDYALIMAICIVASVWLKSRRHHYMLTSAICLLALVVVTFVNNMYIYDCWSELFDSRFDITYFNMALPFAIAALSCKEELQT